VTKRPPSLPDRPLEPAYDVGGDCFDYALNHTVFDLAVFDAMGHGLQAALVASLAVGSYRHDRRENQPLQEMHSTLDDALAQQFQGSVFATVLLARIELDTARAAAVLTYAQLRSTTSRLRAHRSRSSPTWPRRRPSSPRRRVSIISASSSATVTTSSGDFSRTSWCRRAVNRGSIRSALTSRRSCSTRSIKLVFASGTVDILTWSLPRCREPETSSAEPSLNPNGHMSLIARGALAGLELFDQRAGRRIGLHIYHPAGGHVAITNYGDSGRFWARTGGRTEGSCSGFVSRARYTRGERIRLDPAAAPETPRGSNDDE
jgi:hypothetical protein